MAEDVTKTAVAELQDETQDINNYFIIEEGHYDNTSEDLSFEVIPESLSALPDSNTDTIRDNSEAKHKRVLRELCIEEITSYNFGLKDILTVTSCSMNWKEPKSLKEKILNIIIKLVMLDYSCHNMLLSLKDTQQDEYSSSASCDNENHGNERPENNKAIDIDNNYDDWESLLTDVSEELQGSMQNILHLSDVIVIIMNCCDNILRQIIIQKMTICHIAVPLILPNLSISEPMFLLWAMRFLSLEWKTRLSGVQEENPVDYCIPVVSAIRLSDLSKSKSKMLNCIVSDQTHDIFYHRDCEGGHLPRKLSNGLVELTWYLPGCRKEDHFDNILAFANLRGEVKHHSIQFDFLNKVSSSIIIFLSLESISDPDCHHILKKLSESNQQLIFVFLCTVIPLNSEDRIKNVKNFKTLMGNKKYKTILESERGKVKNGALLMSEIRNSIRVSLNSCFNMKVLAQVANDHGIEIDENRKSCNVGKELADHIIDILHFKSIRKMKIDYLPLQGEFWSEWSTLAKQRARMDGAKGRDQEGFILEITGKMEECRKKQFNLVKNMTPVMNNFIQNLMQLNNNHEYIINFLLWMKFHLDVKSKKLQIKNEKTFQNVWDCKQSNFEQLNETERELDSASLGLEHFIREIGQVYETIVDCKDNASYEKLMKDLPRFAADLLIGGFPLEIMDGDARHVPLKWVRAVFDRLKATLGDKKIFVISVLGIQSSGKSTLLNTMFGLNFQVSAGRCTKGLFAQLISVDKLLNDNLGYDYILILDTEGLRAPELGNDKISHDNELATLVIGMGAVTIVNIRGENTSEIEDILQIAVHAFIRMRIVNKSMKLQPGCFFVHQCVPGVNASQKMIYGYKKIHDKLDNMTTAIAEQENISEIKSFRDVIEFDVKKNICYMPNLWKGDPPMAPANPSYSEKVLELKTNILNYPSEKKKDCLTFTDLSNRIIDLWNAILYENFVFSFKNSQEVKSYTQLEEKISSISWEFRGKVKVWINGKLNKILSCKEENIISYQETVRRDLQQCIAHNQIDFKKDLEDFFSSAKDKNILVQWKSNSDLKLQNLSDELRSEAIKTCNNHFELCQVKFDQKKKIKAYQEKVQEFVRKVVGNKLNSELTEKSLNDLFEKQWHDWIEGLSFPTIGQQKNIKGDIIDILRQYFNMHGKEIQDTIDTIDQAASICDLDNIPTPDDSDFQISVSPIFGTFGSKITHGLGIAHSTSLEKIGHFILEIMRKTDIFLNEIKSQDYDKNFVWEICKKVEKEFQLFNEGKLPVILKKNYQIKVTFHILRCAISHFKKMHSQYRNKNDPKNILIDIYKPQVRNIFIGTYTQCKK
ncbi:unnamed protein product, partial [Meganyctiphanes norvegica]